MTINIPSKFIFVAGLKTASTSIEEQLGIDGCGLRIKMTKFGKHLKVSEMEERFEWIFKELPLEYFFIFSVIRDPLNYLLSLYNFSHKRRV